MGRLQTRGPAARRNPRTGWLQETERTDHTCIGQMFTFLLVSQSVAAFITRLLRSSTQLTSLKTSTYTTSDYDYNEGAWSKENHLTEGLAKPKWSAHGYLPDSKNDG